MLTPSDLRNPKAKSGYNNVTCDDYSDGRVRPKPYRAKKRLSSTASGPVPVGPRRATALEAAQDYCDYANGNNITTPVRLKTSGHKTRRKPGRQVPPEVAAAYGVIRDHRARVKESAQNYIYLIAEWGGEAVKIGESAKPPARPAELQTGNPRTLVLIAYYPTDIKIHADKPVHQQFAGDHVKDEWFRPTDAVLSHFGVSRDEFLRRCGGDKHASAAKRLVEQACATNKEAKAA